MKRLTLYIILNLILVVIYIILLFVQAYVPFVKLELNQFWFPTLIIGIGLLLILKAIIFKDDSSTWFGTFLLLNGIMLFWSFYLPYNYTTLWPTLFSAAAISSLFVGIFFKDWLHYKISSFLIIISASFYLYAFKIIGLGWFLLWFFLAIILAVFVGSLIPERFYLNKKEK